MGIEELELSFSPRLARLGVGLRQPVPMDQGGEHLPRVSSRIPITPAGPNLLFAIPTSPSFTS